MPRILRIEARDAHRVFVAFENGVCGEYDLSTRLFGSIFKPLKDLDFFRKVTLDEFGAPCWPNGADLAPDALYQRLSTEA